MIKVLGVLLVWCGCALWGMRAAAVLRFRGEVLEDIGLGLERMERELALNRSALPELLQCASERKTRQGEMVFTRCRIELEKGNCFTYSWQAALDSVPLKRQDRQLLSGLCHLLGRYEADGQVQTLSRLREMLDRHTARIRRQGQELGKVYRVLGIAAGGFLSLMLL